MFCPKALLIRSSTHLISRPTTKQTHHILTSLDPLSQLGRQDPGDLFMGGGAVGASDSRNGKRKKDAETENKNDPSSYRILKEGEAEILMHGNDVFYNKTQVVNRDISIAVLRAFVVKREEEFTLEKNKRGQPAQSISVPLPVSGENDRSGGVDVDGQAAANEINVALEGYAEELTNSLAVGNGKDGVQAGKVNLDNENEVTIAVSPSAEPVEEHELKEIFGIKFTEVPQHGTNCSSDKASPRPLIVLEALAASGLRSLRYAREVDGIGSVTALDNDKVAVEACIRNIKLNGSVAISKVKAEQADARVYMLTHEKAFDAVDLDPYGSPSVFLDSAVQAVADGGLLLCTATDMAVLCGNNGEVCYAKYGGYPLRGKYCHEMAIRILLATIESHANRYKRHIVPVLSLSVDFYVRVFVRIYTSANAMKETPSKLAYVYQCVGCDSFHLQPVGRVIQKNNSARYVPGTGPTILPQCEQCEKHFNMGGPIWAAPIHDAEWVDLILSNVNSMRDRYPAFQKVHSILTTVSEELLDVPLYLSLHGMSATLKCTPPSAVIFRSAVINAGYRVSGTHTNPLGLKTDAPMTVLWDIMRCWVKAHPVKESNEVTPASIILSKTPALVANFTRARAAQSKAQVKKVARFLPNPEENWGPKLRAGRQLKPKHVNLIGASEFKMRSSDNQQDLEHPNKRAKELGD